MQNFCNMAHLGVIKGEGISSILSKEPVTTIEQIGSVFVATFARKQPFIPPIVEGLNEGLK